MSDLLDESFFSGGGGDGDSALPLGEALMEKGALSEDQLRIALHEQGSSGDPLGKVLVRLGFVTEATIRDILSAGGDAQVVDLRKINVDPEVLERIPQDVAKNYNIFPIKCDEERKVLTIAVANPNDLMLADQVRAFMGGEYEVEYMVSEESEIARAVDEYYGLELSIEGILHEIETGEAAPNLQGESTSNPTVRLVNAFMTDAVKRGASDIHFEPEESFLRVRYRIDGVLRQIRSLHRSYWNGMSVRLKVMSEMNIAESRMPQDGRISFTLYGRIVDFRVACQPCTHGENFVLRILDQQRNISKIDNLGLSDRGLEMLRLMMSRPHGILMVTGPTGSGKTTTLYSIIQHLNREGVNIMTLEDPVEYPLPMIRQSAVSDTSKMDWAAGVKSMLRQDPDIILVGEVRENETAELVFRAAMTGHLVLTTLHTNSAISTLPRLTDMGVLPDILATNISGVVAQRLSRRLCPQCRTRKETVTDDERRILSHFYSDEDIAKMELMDAPGCNACEHQGYRGRFAVIEILRVNEELDELISNRATSKELRQAALDNGCYYSMAESGLEKVAMGLTTIAELGRVVDLTPYMASTPASKAGQAA